MCGHMMTVCDVAGVDLDSRYVGFARDYDAALDTMTVAHVEKKKTSETQPLRIR